MFIKLSMQSNFFLLMNSFAILLSLPFPLVLLQYGILSLALAQIQLRSMRNNFQLQCSYCTSRKFLSVIVITQYGLEYNISFRQSYSIIQNASQFQFQYKQVKCNVKIIYFVAHKDILSADFSCKYVHNGLLHSGKIFYSKFVAILVISLVLVKIKFRFRKEFTFSHMYMCTTLIQANIY